MRLVLHLSKMVVGHLIVMGLGHLWYHLADLQSALHWLIGGRNVSPRLEVIRHGFEVEVVVWMVVHCFHLVAVVNLQHLMVVYLIMVNLVVILRDLIREGNRNLRGLRIFQVMEDHLLDFELQRFHLTGTNKKLIKFRYSYMIFTKCESEL